MNACQRELRHRLAAAGGWLARPDLERGISYSTGRVDDELADLVAGGAVLFNERSRQYRLAGTPMALSALKRLVDGGPGKRLAIVGRPSADKLRYQVGMARRVGGEAGQDPGQDAGQGAEQLVMCELELDNPTTREGQVMLGYRLIQLADQHCGGAA